MKHSELRNWSVDAALDREICRLQEAARLLKTERPDLAASCHFAATWLQEQTERRPAPTVSKD